METQIAMLWMRGELSFVEQLCVRSFLDAGHSVVLHTYGPVERVPEGVELCDASEILPEAVSFDGDRVASPGMHSMLFRFKLLERSERTIWADPDVYCLRRLELIHGRLFGWESEFFVAPDLIALPQESLALAGLLEALAEVSHSPNEGRHERDALDPVPGADVGSDVWVRKTLTRFLHQSNEAGYALPQNVFHPFRVEAWEQLLSAGGENNRAITDETCSVHLHGPQIRRALGEASGGLPDPDSLIGQYLVKHGIDPSEAPLPDCPEPEQDHPFLRRYRQDLNGPVYPAAALNVRPLENVVAVTTMRNEGPFILDWVAYHLGVGVTHFLVYTNDCEDGTDAILDALAEKGLVTRVNNAVGSDEKPQRQALADAATHPLVRRADAVVVMDVDEYINIHVGDGRLTDLFAAAGDPDLISMTWRLFGTSGVANYQDLPVAEQFTHAAPLKTRKPHQAWGFKTMFRREAGFNAFGVHRPQEPTTDMPHWTNGSGVQMPERYLEKGWRSALDCWGYDLVTLNHYAVRSCESFLVKRDRGRTNHIARPQGFVYWNAFNRNDEVDRSILPRLALGNERRQAFADDAALVQLHAHAVEWHRARIADLKQNPRELVFFGAISAEPMSNDVEAVDLPDVDRAPPTVLRENKEVFTLRRDPPATGQAAEAQFAGLMARTQQRQPILEPLPHKPNSERILVISSMKNEGCFILEWVAYHLSIGVTHFLVYTNDCDDPTDAILERLEALGIVTRRDNPFNREAGQKPQRGALNDANALSLVRDADWVGIIDVDEYVNIHVGAGTFAELVSAANDPNVISMTWRFFGNKGVHAYEDRWQTEQFTACAPLYIPKPRLGWGFKSFHRPDGPFGKIGVHRPLDLDETRRDDVRWVNGAGRVMPDRVTDKNEWFSRKDSIGYDLVTLNHYVLRSAESFLVKRQRGRINHVDQDQGVAYWCNRNYATETDTSIFARLPRARIAYDRLIADPVLSDLHRNAVAWHRERISLLMKDAEYRSLYAAITDRSHPDAIWRERDTAEARQGLEAAE